MARSKMLACTLLMAVAAGVGTAATVTLACDTCVGASAERLYLDHPRASEINSATRDAVEDGVLPAAAEGELPRGFLLSSPESLKETLAPDASSEAGVSLIMVDTGTKRVIVAPKSSQASTHTIITTTRTLHALVSKQVTVSTAIDAGIWVVEQTTASAPKRDGE